MSMCLNMGVLGGRSGHISTCVHVGGYIHGCLCEGGVLGCKCAYGCAYVKI